MTKENLDQEFKLHIVTLGRATFVSPDPIHYEKLPGVDVYVDAGAKTLLKKLVENTPGIDVAQEYKISTKLVSRLRRALGITLETREGTSETTAWRRKRGKSE